MGSGKFNQLPWRKYVYGIDTLNVGPVNFERVLTTAATKAGIVDKDVYCAIGFDGKFDKGCQIGFVEYVADGGRSYSTGFDDFVGSGGLCRRKGR